MTQLALHKDTHDIFMDPTGQLVMLSTDDETIMQRIKTTFHTFRGEWFLTTGEGVDYYAEVFRKNPDLAKVRAFLVDILTNIQGVSKVLSFEVTLVDAAARKLLVKFHVKLTTGNTAQGEL